MPKRIIYWFRNDLRLDDNEGFLKATQDAEEVLPLYIFDTRQFRDLPLGFPKIGLFRAQFLLESVQNLRDNLKKKGANLLIYIGKPETIIPNLAHEWKVECVYTSKEATYEETEIESAVSKHLKVHNVDLEHFWLSTLYHPRDLPFWVSRLPDVFTEFRKAVEAQSSVRAPYPAPMSVTVPSGITFDKLPELYELLLFSLPPQADKRAAMIFRGGETEALRRLDEYVWQKDHLRHYKDTRNQLLGADYSSKLSPWLALGCISPRRVYQVIKQYETERVANDSTYWLIFELLWRDYFRFVGLKYGTRLFQTTGIQNNFEHQWQTDRELFERWTHAETGVPWVDANMLELRLTGYMSNRGRQNVASFLAKDLGIKWTWGAAYFESQLIDYDVCSNWGNWNYIAGVGNDPRENRYFNQYKQATRYDAEGKFVKHWFPQLTSIPTDKVHQPWNLSETEQQKFNLFIGDNWPEIIINGNKWLTKSLEI